MNFPVCTVRAGLTKRNMERSWLTKYDSALKETIRQAKQVPALINYTIDGKRFKRLRMPNGSSFD